MSPTARDSRHGAVPPGVLAFLVLIPSLFLLAAGIKAWLTARANPFPKTLTYAEFAIRMPKFGWYTITGAYMDVARSVYWEQNHVCISVFAPLLPADGNKGADSDIYVELSDPKTLSAFMDLSYARKRDGEAGAQKFISQHSDIFVQRRNVSGLVSFGHRDPIGDWAKVGLDASNTTFVEDGWHPNLVLGYGGTAAGFVLTVICAGIIGKRFARSRRKAPRDSSTKHLA